MNGRPELNLVASLGCLSLLAVVCLLCMMPLLLVEVMHSALERLHLAPAVATLALLGIFIGSLINYPVYRIERNEFQPAPSPLSVFGFWGSDPFINMRQDTVIAVNVGGCIIPTVLALWQVIIVAGAGGWPATAMLIVAAGNILACYWFARPVRGIGIAMPAFISPLTAVGLAWLMLMPSVYNEIRAPIAFVGGVAGPVIGADLLHLRDMTRVSAGMLSIGGAGTFDGIVLSGILAVLLA